MKAQELDLTARTAGPRYTELDSLRGLAACTVVVHHYRMAYSLRFPVYIIPVSAGRQAVMLFFVLSGFVLSLPFWNKGGNGPYLQYFVRRLFRIYVPYVVAVAVSAVVAKNFLYSRLPLGEWFGQTWQTKITGQLLWSHLTMSGLAQLNTAFWSLRYEVQMSLIFPVVLLVLQKVKPSAAAMTAILLLISSAYIAHLQSVGPLSYLNTIQFGAMFVVGAVLAQCRATTRKFWDRISDKARWGMLAFSIFLYYGYADMTLHKVSVSVPGYLLTVLGSCGIIVCAMYMPPMHKLLKRALPEYLGRISYSMYLVHGTVLFFLLNTVHGRLTPTQMEIVYLVLTLVISHLFCIGIEEPSLRLGKLLSSELARSRRQMSEMR